MSDSTSGSPPPPARGGLRDYQTFLANHRDFRNLWYGQTVSLLGDWFDSVALYALVLQRTDSASALAGLVIAQLLPGTFAAPFAGVLADRFPRKTLMIVSDLARAFLVLLLLFAPLRGMLWIIYPVMVLKVMCASLFEPARNAVIPSIVPRERNVVANTISSFTWSTMLALGGLLGGGFYAVAGYTASILLDAGTFVLSAWFISRVRYRQPVRQAHEQRGPLSDMIDGFRFLARQGHILSYALVKFGIGVAGGTMVLYPVFAKQVFPLGRDAAISIGLFMTARGVGTAIGPILARRYGGDGGRFLRHAIGPAMFVSASGLLMLTVAPTMGVAFAVVLFGHMGGAVAWVFSTVLLQLASPDEFRGRVFAAELTLFTLAMAVSVFLTGWLQDVAWSPRQVALALGCVQLVPACVFFGLLRRPAPEDTGAP